MQYNIVIIINSHPPSYPFHSKNFSISCTRVKWISDGIAHFDVHKMFGNVPFFTQGSLIIANFLSLMISSISSPCGCSVKMTCPVFFFFKIFLKCSIFKLPLPYLDSEWNAFKWVSTKKGLYFNPPLHLRK